VCTCFSLEGHICLFSIEEVVESTKQIKIRLSLMFGLRGAMALPTVLPSAKHTATVSSYND